MADAKKLGHGTTLAVDHDSNASYTTLGKVSRIAPNARVREKVDVSDLDSTLVEYLPGSPIDEGEVSFDICWHPGETNTAILDTLADNGTIVSWKITTPHGTPKVGTFSGFVMSSTAAEIVSKGEYKTTIVVCLTTKITWA